ncbi:MAG TPA: DAK2 domain-containing protein [Nocardioidaceae bacterium]|nr:DAK2 domain-containing protein [Nocardioidaceae bacterium]
MLVAGPPDAVSSLDVRTVVRFSRLALSALGAAREEIDALNVYPVPDADTGTNLFLTLEAAHDALQEVAGDPEDPRSDDAREALRAFARGALLGARGNSGVILSQIVGAACKQLASANPRQAAAPAFAEALASATEASYAAVGRPVEGTILSVARAASDAASAAVRDGSTAFGQVVRAAADAAREALAKTPQQLATLAQAGVVDAGGRGLCVVLDALETTVTGRRRLPTHAALGTRAIPVPLPSGDLAPGGPAYEVMYLLDAEDERVPALRARLDPLGDCLVVVGGDGLWNVHVHVDDVGAALEEGIAAGRPHRIRVTHFAEQRARPGVGLPALTGPLREGRTVVVMAAGAGLADLFSRAGATVVPGEPGRRASTAQVEQAVVAAGTTEVIVLPDDRESLDVAEAAARTVRERGAVRVAVIPTDAQVQGLAALAVHEPGRTFEQDIVEMTAAARHARSGAVTVAQERAITMAGPCEPGDVLGMIEGDYVLVGRDLLSVAVQVLERLLGGGGELVTLVAGAGSGDLADGVASYLQQVRPTVDVVVYDGGQPHHPLLVGVE